MKYVYITSEFNFSLHNFSSESSVTTYTYMFANVSKNDDNEVKISGSDFYEPID